ncbi:Hypothetical predicted protein [Cloeon dipterum]|uniref:Uncharacterized protein n=1 Tax=Cloeon dipterum TaxID=197152 RepID=A0A8S1CAT8_9INSE|nr:Hypothetical predicted protein [Cloeon dipterum]
MKAILNVRATANGKPPLDDVRVIELRPSRTKQPPTTGDGEQLPGGFGAAAFDGQTAQSALDGVRVSDAGQHSCDARSEMGSVVPDSFPPPKLERGAQRRPTTFHPQTRSSSSGTLRQPHRSNLQCCGRRFRLSWRAKTAPSTTDTPFARMPSTTCPRTLRGAILTALPSSGLRNKVMLSLSPPLRITCLRASVHPQRRPCPRPANCSEHSAASSALAAVTSTFLAALPSTSSMAAHFSPARAIVGKPFSSGNVEPLRDLIPNSIRQHVQRVNVKPVPSLAGGLMKPEPPSVQVTLTTRVPPRCCCCCKPIAILVAQRLPANQRVPRLTRAWVFQMQQRLQNLEGEHRQDGYKVRALHMLLESCRSSFTGNCTSHRAANLEKDKL